MLRIVVVSLAIALLQPGMAIAAEEGRLAPEFRAVTLDGQRFNSIEARGNVIIVNFWATWCAPCRYEMPALERYYQRHRDEGLEIIAVAMDNTSEDAAVRAAMRGYSYPAAFGRNASVRSFGQIWRLPSTFIIDRDGILIRDGSSGIAHVDLESLEREVTPLLRARSAARSQRPAARRSAPAAAPDNIN